MSNAELKSRLNQLENTLRQVKQYNTQLHGEIDAVANGVSRAHQDLESYNEKIRSSLDGCNISMRSSHQYIVDSIELQGEIERLYSLFKNVELANKKIRMANNKKYYDFANYRTIRKIVQGMMDNLDVKMVSDNTITKSVEVQHLQTPDYWLTCVLISVMAWRNDDRELAERAVERAVKLDRKNSAVFYMLFNLRMERDDAALKWFNIYQQCELKGSDQRTFLMLFSLVSKTINESVDEKTRDEVFAFIKKVVSANMKAAGYSEDEIVRHILNYFDRMRSPGQLKYPLLRKYCNEADSLNLVMNLAKNNENILEFVLGTVNVPVDEKNTFLKGYIEDLIETPNEAETEVYDEIAYNELIIDRKGDVEAANKQFEAEKAKKADDLNLIAEMIDWIYERDAYEVNGQVRLSMFVLTKDIQEKAVDAYAKRYQSQHKANRKVTIGDYSTVVNFIREDEEQAKVTKFFTEKRDVDLAAVKNWPAIVGFIVGIAAAIGCFFAAKGLAAVAVGGVGFGIIKLLLNRSRRKQIKQSCAENIRITSETLSKMFEEFRQYLKELDEYDSYHDRILDELHKI